MAHKLYQVVEVLKQGYSNIRIDDKTVICIGSAEEQRLKKHYR